MKDLFLTLITVVTFFCLWCLLAFLVLGCATAPIQKVETEECDRLVYNPQAGELEEFVCLGESLNLNGTIYKLLAEAVHPGTKALMAFFDFTGDCEIDGVGLYSVSNGAYYLRQGLQIEKALQLVRITEERTGMELLKQVPCLKKL